MASDDDDEDASSIDSELEWELEEGIPQPEDPFIQKYMTGRNALVAQEQKQRHDHIFKSTMTPLAKQAARIMSSIRKRELREVWTSEYEESLADQNGGNLYPGMMFSLARDRMEKTEIWKMIEKMPKGALLHAHLDAMIDVDWLIDQTLAEPGMCIVAQEGLSDPRKREIFPMQFRVYPDDEIQSRHPASSSASIWSANYHADTPIPIREAARTFPDDSTTFKKWLLSRCTITPEESLHHHHGLDAIWRKFQRTIPLVDWMLMYEPILRRALTRLFTQLAADGITYTEVRTAFMFEYRQTNHSHGPDNHDTFLQTFQETLGEFKSSAAGSSFHGARIIWTCIRRQSNRELTSHMKNAIAMKKKYPALISGFDFVAQEDQGRTLSDLTPVIFWFKKSCAQAGVDLPFFFHAGECLGDGDSTDNNLFDAVLLGTRRIGHGYSLYKHPLLTDMVRDQKILVESCPISNEILRLSSSILAHSLPALLARGVACSLNNDDPAILGHGRNGLTHDFCQSYLAWENLGLPGLATLAENSVRWSCLEDQRQKEWIEGIERAYMGNGLKARLLKGWRSEFEKWCQWICEEWALEGLSDDEVGGGDDEDDEEEEDEEEEEEDDDDDDDDEDEDEKE